MILHLVIQKDLNHTAFKSIVIKLPSSLQEQKAIASILSALDDKIENNLQMNKTLEEMAMALIQTLVCRFWTISGWGVCRF